jgi:glycosyltransferase involved in cell wall biosynthesis
MKYLNKRGVVRPLLGRFDRGRHYQQVLVIPALAEAEYLPLTLQSIFCNEPESILNDTLVLVVVNNASPKTDASLNQDELREYIRDNAVTLQWLEAQSRSISFPLAWIDASSPGNELPPRSGVGLARKIGCDSAIEFLTRSNQTTNLKELIIFSLDADTLVSSNYLETAGNELRKNRCGGGIIFFTHQQADTADGQYAIDAYEKFLHYYVDGLRWAGSPYAFHTIGSCLCFTAEGYLRANGFPARCKAGEDFYFINELVKTSSVCEIRNTTVFPSTRISRRVPFGTGRRMADALLNDKKDFSVYDFRVFDCLRDLLSSISVHPHKKADPILSCLRYPVTRDFLEHRKFPVIWERFQRQYKSADAVVSAFHRWFDGFVTLKYIHWLTENVWPRRPLEEIPASAFSPEPQLRGG